MQRESFIELLNRSSPNEVREFLAKKGKRKLISPFIEIEELAPEPKVFKKEDFKDAEVVVVEGTKAKTKKK